LIAAYLTTLLKKQLFLWTLKATAAFLALKQAVTTPLVLHLQDFSKPFVIECNTSGSGLGAVLMQETQPISFLSKALKG
jgi:hypothetical protein